MADTTHLVITSTQNAAKNLSQNEYGHISHHITSHHIILAGAKHYGLREVRHGQRPTLVKAYTGEHKGGTTTKHDAKGKETVPSIN